MIDDVRFSKILTLMAESLPMFGRVLSERMREMYWLALADVSDDDFAAACVRCMRELTAFPTPAEILDRRPAQDDLETRAARTFLAILRASRHNPANGMYWRESEIAQRFGRAAADAFVVAGATGGFRAAMDPDRERFIRRDFITAYVRLGKADPTALGPESAPALQPGVVSIIGKLKDQLSLPPAKRPSAEQLAAKKAAFRKGTT